MTKQRPHTNTEPGAVLACRVSHDPKMRMRSTSQQEGELRGWCDDEGWAVRAVLTESDVSASRFASPAVKRQRAAWLAELAEQLARPEVDRLLVWEASRATREMVVSLTLVDLCEESGVLFGYGGQLYDLSRARARATVLHDFVDAEREAGQTSERVKRDMRANAKAGRPHGRLLYGYRRVRDDRTGELVGQVPEPAQAAIVREIFKRFAQGETVHSIAADLNRRGEPMPSAGAQRPWYDMRLRKMLANPAYLGHRVHQGAVVGVADWPALIDQATFDKVTAMLTEGAPRFGGTHSRAAKHLLSGIVHCGRCGAPMYRQLDSGRPILKCVRGGGHLVRAYDPLDAWLTELLLVKLETEDVELAERPDDPATVAARAEADDLRRELEEGRARFEAGAIPMTTFLFAEATLLEKLKAAQGRVRPARTVPQVVLDLVGPDARQRWDALPSDGKRDALAAVLSVTVLAGVRGRHGFDKETVKVEPLL
jgi:site-specific DNA recombinase